MKSYIAIDPGKKGGIAFGSSLTNASATNMPDNDEEILALFPRTEESPTVIVHMESLVKFTGVKMPGSFMAVYAGNHGFVRGVLRANGYKVIQVGPKEWQKVHGLKREKGESKTSWKNRLKTLAVELFPHLKVTLLNADALLILDAAMRGLI
jgi:hypothetical protein